MSELVNPSEIETLVGANRHVTNHIARWDSRSGQVYILHSYHCLDSGIDLRDCEYSHALDKGLSMFMWWAERDADRPVVVSIQNTGTYGKELVPDD